MKEKGIRKSTSLILTLSGNESTQPKAMPPFYPSITAKESIEKDASSSKVVKAVNIVLSCSDKIVPMQHKLELMT